MTSLASRPLFRNRLTLWGKYLFDELRQRNAFLHFGQHLQSVQHLVADHPQTVWFPTTFFLDRGLAWQTTIARALEVRGHKVIFSHFDIVFPRRNGLYFDIQDRGFISSYYQLYTNTLLEGFGFTHQPFSRFGSSRKFQVYRATVASLSLAQCQSFTYRDFPLGSYVKNPLIHYFRCSPTTTGPKILAAWKDFLAMGMIMVDTFETAFDKLQPTLVVLLNGSFLDSRLQLEMARRRGLRVITFEAGFMLNSLMLGINEPIITFPMAKYLPTGYQKYQLTPAQQQQLNGYLASRSQGKKNVFDYWGTPVFDEHAIRTELGLTATDQPDVLFTNLLWDSAMLDCDIAFPNQIEWIDHTIRWYAEHPDRQLLIRIHPAETQPPNLATSDRIEEAIRANNPKLPPNVTIISPSSKVSSYPLTTLANLTIVYSSTAGLEAAIMGKPVIVTGKTHYRSQGFTHDINTQAEYDRLLDHPAPASETDIVAAARTYAYFFFFGYNIPFPLVVERATNDRLPAVEYHFSSEQQLLPGQQAELDFIIDVLLGARDYTDRLSGLL